jgi:hypothetical protein
MRRARSMVLGVAVVAGLASVTPAHAITFGDADEDRHPNVGALLTDRNSTSPGPEIVCSATLIAPDVVLTAAHCGGGLPSTGEAEVTFDSDFDDDAPDPATYSGTFVPHPDFGFSGPGGRSDPHDIAVVLLDEPVAHIAPAELPTLGLLDQLRAQHALDDTMFTAVGYGVVRETKTGGPHGFIAPDGQRRYALQEALSLQKHWLTLSMNPSTGNGGTCYGDSGGPHFLGDEDSDLLVSITVTGDAMCRATDQTYRLDTASAQNFLDDHVALP